MRETLIFTVTMSISKLLLIPSREKHYERKMFISIGIQSKIVNVIKSMYDNSECALTIDGNLASWFKVNVSARQGCLLSHTLFNIFLEFVFN